MLARRLALAILFVAGIAAFALFWGERSVERSVVSAVVPPKPRPHLSPTPSATTTAAPYVIRHILDTGGPIRFGKWFWDEAGAADGPILITVDVDAQVLSIFRGGWEIGTTAVIFGADHKPTPLGVFPITQKDADHVSNLYGAPMPYMLRLTNDGVSIHGSPVEYGYATHGCIGVPIPFAKKLFAAVKLGDTVVVTRGERLAVGGAATAVR